MYAALEVRRGKEIPRKEKKGNTLKEDALLGGVKLEEGDDMCTTIYKNNKGKKKMEREGKNLVASLSAS